MPRVTFVQPGGARRVVDIACGSSVMLGALAARIPGILAQCGGLCQCATCHCHVDAAWLDRLPPPSDAERDLIDFAREPGPDSRLACQIRMVPELDGLVMHVPAEQL